MAYNQKIAYRHNNYATRKIPYTKILTRIKIVELFKQLLFMACGG